MSRCDRPARAAAAPKLRDERLQVEAFEQLHDVVEGPVLRRAEVVDVHGVRRPQRRRRLRLALEPADELPAVAAEGVGADELDRGGPRQQPVARPPDFAHAAAAEELFQVIAPHLVPLLGLDVHPVDEPREDDRDARRQIAVGRNITRESRPAASDCRRRRDQEAERIHRRGREGREDRLAARRGDDERIGEDADGDAGPAARRGVHAASGRREKSARCRTPARPRRPGRGRGGPRGEHVPPRDPGDREGQQKGGRRRASQSVGFMGGRAEAAEELPVPDGQQHDDARRQQGEDGQPIGAGVDEIGRESRPGPARGARLAGSRRRFSFPDPEAHRCRHSPPCRFYAARRARRGGGRILPCEGEPTPSLPVRARGRRKAESPPRLWRRPRRPDAGNAAVGSVRMSTRRDSIPSSEVANREPLPGSRKVYVAGPGGMRVPLPRDRAVADEGDAGGDGAEPSLPRLRHLGALHGSRRSRSTCAKGCPSCAALDPRAGANTSAPSRCAATCRAWSCRARASVLRGRGTVDPDAFRPQGDGHARDGVRRDPGERRQPSSSASEVARGRAIIPANINHPESEPMAIGQELPRQDQRQHRQLRRDVLDRGGSREDDLGDPLGRRHGHGPLDRERTSTRPASGSCAILPCRSGPCRSTRRWRRPAARPRT